MEENINSIGLVIDIIGVLVLAIYNLPDEVIHKEGQFYQAANMGNDHPDTIAEKNRYRKCRRYTKLGYALLIFGFGLQLSSNYLAFFLGN